MNSKAILLALVMTLSLLAAGCPEPPKPPDEVKAKPAEGADLVELFNQIEQELDRIEEQAKSSKPTPRLDKSQKHEFDLAGAPTEGTDTPKLTLVVFSDFECPFCSRFAGTAHEVVKEYGDQVQSVFMNFPLHNDCNAAVGRAFHRNACLAAEAAMAANEEGKFWEMHDYLFANQRSLTEDGILKFAEEKGMNAENIKAAIQTGKYNALLMAQAKQLADAGGRGTPSVYINGYKAENVRWDDKDQVSEFIAELLSPEEEKGGVKPTVSNLGQLPSAKVVLSDGTRLDDRLNHIVERLGELEFKEDKPKRPKPKKPDPNMKYKFNTSERPVRGPEDAPVELVVFTDFTCPYCAKMATALDEIKEEFPDKLKIVFKNVPNPRHRFSVEAHEAGMEAFAQGKFWEMHDIVFKNRSNLSVEFLKETAEKLGMDMAKYDEAMEKHTHRNALILDIKEADAAKVSATPTVFINGKFQTSNEKEALVNTIKQNLK